jgi:putative tryptophan/tyrosine transport system ATP-binding protein
MITLEDIHVTFARGTPLEMRALRGIDLVVPSGQFLTVIGSNGAGKSTALNVMAGGVRPDSGRVMIDDVDVTDRPIHSRARLVSRVFQDPKMGTCDDMTILENFAIAQGRTNPRGFRFAIDRSLRKHVGERLESLKLGLEHRLNDKVGLLSGGQRQAINLLMSTVGQTRVLLLDEHAAALDPRTGEFVMELTQDIVRSLSLTAVMVTHSMAQALQFGDRTVMFHRGKIIFDVDGEQRAAMTVTDLLRLFRRDQGEELADDALLLG